MASSVRICHTAAGPVTSQVITPRERRYHHRCGRTNMGLVRLISLISMDGYQRGTISKMVRWSFKPLSRLG